MKWTLFFVFAMPALFAAVLLGMYKFGVGKTDWNPPPPAGPYEEPTDGKKLVFIAWISLALYVVMLASVGPWGAAVALAVVLGLLLAGSLIFTCVQQIIFLVRGPIDPTTNGIVERRPFFSRLLHNFLNSFAIITP